ncbi:hypothetical protein FZO89_05700 [Luteimonas viscosa]|uniref:Uncharacterized protein n=1 Tax=Luteimonas viscosa TaxID=1132694 RepID=A0A5D4XM81_9GAMM|nr:hypothetical protein [Luteimonas viscosa]TYT25788.1 hypothetical protein FZO89_05700 [Luteimonas viscosa]
MRIVRSLFLLAALALPWGTVAAQSPPTTITLTRNGDVGNAELVNLGIPFPQGMLTDAARVRILAPDGAEVPAFVAPTLRWHWADNSIRAVRVQFQADPDTTYRFDISRPRTRSLAAQPYDNGTRAGKMGAPVPRVIATLDPAWLTHSQIAGPQLPYAADRDYDRYVDRQWQWARDTSYSGVHAFLFDRASVIGYQYVRSGRPDVFLEFYNSATFYLSKIKRTGGGGGWPDCTGGWEFDGVSPCDPKYGYLTPHLLLAALAGDDTRLDAATVQHVFDNQVRGGWNGALGPYTGGHQAWTERQVGLALAQLVAGYQLTGEASMRRSIEDVLGWLYAHQQTPPASDPFTGAWTHSWQAHEGLDYDAATDVRGGSPWMSANIVGGLWHAWLVTGDERIPTMLRDFGRYLEQHGFASDAEAGDWLSGCNAGGTIGWYFSSAVSPRSRVVAIQDDQGYGSDAHNPELLMAVAAARHFEADPVWRARFEQRAQRLGRYLNTQCAAASHTPRAFNWQHRNPEFAWMLAQSGTRSIRRNGSSPLAPPRASGSGHAAAPPPRATMPATASNASAAAQSLAGARAAPGPRRAPQSRVSITPAVVVFWHRLRNWIDGLTRRSAAVEGDR